MTTSFLSISSLPAELILHILSHLPVTSVIALSTLSTDFYKFCNDPQNESVIWRNLCILHGLAWFSPLGTESSDVGSEPPRREWGRWQEWVERKRPTAYEVKWTDVVDLYSDQSMVGDMDWKAFFRRRVEIHRSWSGQLPSSVQRYSADDVKMASKSHMATLLRAVTMARKLHLENQQRRTPSRAAKRAFGGPSVVEAIRTTFLEVAEHILPISSNVHRIKVDETNGFFITTGRDGGLVVRDIASKSMVWCLPTTYVRGYAHLEYEHGYMIFDRPDGCKEVWRSASVMPHTNVANPPDHRQRLASALVNGDNDELLRSDIRSRRDESVYPMLHDKIGVGHILSVASAFWGGAGSLAYMKLAEFMKLASPMLDAWALGEIGEIENKEDEEEEDAPKRLLPRFVPHAVIPVPQMPQPLLGDGIFAPDPTRAYRFVYPYLLASSTNHAYIWDMRTGDQVQIVDSIQKIHVPKTYTNQGGAPTPAGVVGVLGVSAKEQVSKAGDKARAQDDPTFPAYPPFQTGFFDENAMFSGNLYTPFPGIPRSPNPTSDPLALQTNTPAPLGSIHYVELGERYVFICGEEGLRVFSRGKPKFELGQLVLRIPSDKMYYSRWSAGLGASSVRPHWGSELVRQETVWDEEIARKTEEDANVGEMPSFGRIHQSRGGRRGDDEDENDVVVVRRRRKMYDEFVAVHISPDQKHVAALLSSSRLLLIPWFERVVEGEKSVWDAEVDVQLGSVKAPSVYLSYGGGESGSGGAAGRIGVVTQRGIFVVTPYFRTFSAASFPAREVDLVVMRLAPSFMDPRRLVDVSCLQLSDTGLWVNWTDIGDKEETVGNEATIPTWSEDDEGDGADSYGEEEDMDDDHEWEDEVEDDENEDLSVDRQWRADMEGTDSGGEDVYSKGKGKEPETLPIDTNPAAEKPRSWLTQEFEGRQGDRWKGGSVHRDSVLHEIKFSSSLRERRIVGMSGGDGVQLLPNGDILIETDNAWSPKVARSEVHQIRFVPYQL